MYNQNNSNSNSEKNFNQQPIQQNSNIDHAQNISQYNPNINAQSFVQNDALNSNQSQNMQFNNMSSTQKMQNSPMATNLQEQSNFNQSNLSSNQTPTPNLSTKMDKSKLLVIVIIILAIVTVVILVTNLINKDGENNTNSSSNISNNNSSNTSNNNSSDTSNNSSSNTSDSNSSSELKVIPMNTYANVGEKVEMKVNRVYVEDKFFYKTSTTFKNNSSNDIILHPGTANGFTSTHFAFFDVYFVYKGADFDNVTDEDIIHEACSMSEIVQDDGTVVTIPKEETILKSGKEMNVIITCSITRVKDYANGVEPGMMQVLHYADPNNKIETYFNLRK